MLLVSAAALLLLADPLRIPYPILLVVGGLALGFGPGVPTVTLPPDAVIFGILPPLLYSAAFNTGSARPEAQPAPDLAARDRARGADDGGGRGRGSLRDRPVVAGRVRARCRRLADRSNRGDVDRQAGSAFRAARSRSSRARVWSTTAPRSSSSSSRLRPSSPAPSRFVHAVGDFVWTVLAGIAVGLLIGRAIRFVRFRLNNAPLEITIAFLTGYLVVPARVRRSAPPASSRSSPPASTWAGTRPS